MECIECEYYTKADENKLGTCYRYPKVEMKNQHSKCGEFKKKK